jgi:hypothetical protein
MKFLSWIKGEQPATIVEQPLLPAQKTQQELLAEALTQAKLQGGARYDTYCRVARVYREFGQTARADALFAYLRKEKTPERSGVSATRLIEFLRPDHYGSSAISDKLAKEAKKPFEELEAKITGLQKERDTKLGELEKRYSGHNISVYSAGEMHVYCRSPVIAPETMRRFRKLVIDEYDPKILTLCDERHLLEQTAKFPQLVAWSAACAKTVDSATRKTITRDEYTLLSREYRAYQRR